MEFRRIIPIRLGGINDFGGRCDATRRENLHKTAIKARSRYPPAGQRRRYRYRQRRAKISEKSGKKKKVGKLRRTTRAVPWIPALRYSMYDINSNSARFRVGHFHGRETQERQGERPLSPGDLPVFNTVARTFLAITFRMVWKNGPIYPPPPPPICRRRYALLLCYYRVYINIFFIVIITRFLRNNCRGRGGGGPTHSGKTPKSTRFFPASIYALRIPNYPQSLVPI